MGRKADKTGDRICRVGWEYPRPLQVQNHWQQTYVNCINDTSSIIRSPTCKEIILGFERAGI